MERMETPIALLDEYPQVSERRGWGAEMVSEHHIRPDVRGKPRGRPIRRGVSLVELVAILAIIAILGALAAPRFSRSIAVQRADALARRMIVDLRLAQQHASATGADQEVRFWSNRYQFKGMGHPDRVSQDYTINIDDPPYFATLISVTLDNSGDTIIFDGYGVPDTGGSVVIGVGDQRRTIAIDAESGRAVAQ